MSRFVRASKYRHVYGAPNKRDQCYDNLKVSRNAWDTNLVKANPVFISVNLEAGGGGAFAVIPHAMTGKLPDTLPVYNGHTGAVLDTDFNPFNDYVIASASEDTKVMVWTIPEGGLTENIATPALSLTSHGRKVGHVLFHPTAENVLASSSADFTIKLWDISTGQEKQTLTGHTEIIQSLSWNWTGDLMVTTCKDKKLRIFDVRANRIAQETQGHQGIKGSRVVWLGNLDKIATTGFSRTSDRQVFIWDSTNLSEALKQESIDTASGMLMPYYDQDTAVLYLAGKGDGNIRYYEWVDDEKGLYYLSEYKSSDPARGIGFLPKRAVNVSDVEVARAYKVHVSLVEPISFKVPRKVRQPEHAQPLKRPGVSSFDSTCSPPMSSKIPFHSQQSDAFQADLYPDCVGAEASLSADDFFAGKTLPPKLISLEKGFTASGPKDFVTTAPAPQEPEQKVPQNEKEYQDAYHALKKENDELKNHLTQRDVRIRQLEAQLEAMMKDKN
ncbi:Coronin-like protein crn1 [Quaeritorhiza haematococci]|nr:Coronin-like protein crn1 [Quaeritorhiza haematococci]